LFEVGFSEWMGKKILKVFRSDPRVTLLGLIVVISIVTAFISNSAAMAMFIPIIAAVARASNGKIQQKYLAMPLAFAAVMGGNLTLIGSTPQLAINGVLANMQLPKIQMLTMFGPALVTVILLFIYFVTFGDKVQQKVLAYLPDVSADSAETGGGETKELNITKMAIAGIIFLLSVIGFLSQIWTIGFCGILGASACVIFRCISMKRAFASVDWNAICIMGAVMAVANGVNKAGTGVMVAEWIISLFGGENAAPLALLAALCITAVLLTNIMNNLTVAGMLVPIGVSLSQTLDCNPMPFIVGILFAASFAFATPVGTTPITMTMYVGYKFTDYTKIGGLFAIIGTAATIIMMPIFYPF
jgi:di/tricarboxylate transporter